MSQNNLSISMSFHNQTGPLPIRLTNDYLFRALLQSNNRVLKGLISSLLHLSPEQIQSVEILNPIELGKTIDSKTFILDIRVCLNNEAILNLEMQVINQHNWTDRSLSYLCREYDHLNKGQDYSEANPVIQIGLLDFTLFPAYPEFYASYYILNEKNHHKYSDKLRISVLDLNQIPLATDEDRQYHIDHWAALFKATTWEELKTMAQINQNFEEAAMTIFDISQDDLIRDQIRAREEYYYEQKRALKIQEERNCLAEKLDNAIAERNQIAIERDQATVERDQVKIALNQALKEIELLKNALANKN